MMGAHEREIVIVHCTAARGRLPVGVKYENVRSSLVDSLVARADHARRKLLGGFVLDIVWIGALAVEARRRHDLDAAFFRYFPEAYYVPPSGLRLRLRLRLRIA